MARQIGFVLLLISSNWIHCHCLAAADFNAPVNHKPSFHNCGEYKPTLKEEQEPGTSVLRVAATDPDQSQTIKYSILNEMREERVFAIDEDTGEIFSAYIFDRDPPYRDTEFYITVRATDNGQPSLDDVCTIKVTILDINDNPPVFDKDFYEAFVSMNTTLRQQVTIITAKDIDEQTNNVVNFEIVEEYKDSSYFEIDQHTGVLTLAKRIDRNPGEYYALRVRAYNQGYIENESENPEVDVKVHIIDDDKRLPYFTKVPEVPVILHENFTAFDQILAVFEANSNTNNDSNVIFEIVRGKFEQTNSLHTFLLEQINHTAHIKLARALDYERITEYTITVRATNRHDLATEAVVKIMILDVNDNVPLIVEAVSYLEHELIDNTPVIQIHAYDLDGTSANNIISYSIAESNQLHFTIDSHTGTVTKQNRLNDDEKDIYFIKILAKDNAPSALFRNNKPNMSSHTLIVKIINRDLNIIPQNAITNIHGQEQRTSNGISFQNALRISKSYEERDVFNDRFIMVHNYEGTLTDKLIGSVYFDYDIEDNSNKLFLWDERASTGTRKHFKLNSKSGMIMMLKGTPEGIYNLEFTVIEESSDFSRHKVSARVTVTVKNISTKTVNQSGSIRFYNVTAEKFISQTLSELNTPMYRLQESIASILDTNPDKVDIFTINNRKLTRGAFLDVFFAVDDTIYTSSEVLNAVLSLHLRKLEEDVGYRIVSVGIDECIAKGHMCKQACKNRVHRSQKPIVVHTNTSSFVGMTTLVQAQCIPQIESSLVACLNGGTFQNGKCNCPMGFEGPQCEKLDICFDGSGYAIYPLINSGNVNNISIGLLPRQKDGLVFYMGPLKYDPSLKTPPFLALEINDGMLVLLLDYGTGMIRFEHQQLILHTVTTVDIVLEPHRFEIHTASNKLKGSSRSRYENKDLRGFLPGNMPILLGGTINHFAKGLLYNWPLHLVGIPQTIDYDGCMRKLTINGHMIDFMLPIVENNVFFSSQWSNSVHKSFYLMIFELGIVFFLMLAIFYSVKYVQTKLKLCNQYSMNELETQNMKSFISN
ncbi:DE-cadherin [Anopheles gambiae]|uniref:Cadherin domain-containing protein n=2 Tax=Anopheles coluzzii TaxID=1518534 RepID=A0A6E8WAS9_ANOCL|nr:DE-cadherin [Anopheles gambiae]XP_061502467.1 DE-cadherin [Anopheles gambiae]XP_061502468.1 DE-cadherin [Anopheles gambiae]